MKKVEALAAMASEPHAISSATEADGDHLSHRRRARLDEFPQTIGDDELIAYFTLSQADLALVPA